MGHGSPISPPVQAASLPALAALTELADGQQLDSAILGATRQPINGCGHRLGRVPR